MEKKYTNNDMNVAFTIGLVFGSVMVVFGYLLFFWIVN